MSAGDLVAMILITAGCGFFLAGTVGLIRFPDTLSRLHALTKADNVGLGLICVGLAVHDASLTGAIKLVFIWLLALMAATLSAFLIARWHDDPPVDPEGS